jgi:hypothetical protein
LQSLSQDNNNELSEKKNFNDRDTTTPTPTSIDHSTNEYHVWENTNTPKGKAIRRKNGIVSLRSIQEDDVLEAQQKPNQFPSQQREADTRLLHESYTAYCREFTLSGSGDHQQAKREFDMSMGMGMDNNEQKSYTRAKAACSSSSSVPSPASFSTDNQKSHEHQPAMFPCTTIPILRKSRPPNTNTSSHTYHPLPPPRVLTPSVYMEMQRAAKERNRARRRRFWAWVVS